MSAPDSGRPRTARGAASGDGAGPTDVEALTAEIEATRAHLGRTVHQLSARLDVPARAREKSARARDTAVEAYRESPPLMLGGALTLAGALIALVVWRRKRAARRRTALHALRRRH